MIEEIKSQFNQNIRLHQQAINKLTPQIAKAVYLIIEAYKNGKKLLICGNGGSAADAQHFASELVNKFKIKRKPLPAVSLVADTSILSSIANDIGYDYVFSKQIEALGEKGDVVFVITTSDAETRKGGHSVNIAKALITAKKKEMVTIGLASKKSKKILKLLDIAIKIPSKNTPRIQETHITIIHIICELVEKILFKNEKRKIN